MKRPVAQVATLFFSLAFTFLSVFALCAGSAVAGDDKCTIAVKGDSPTAKACAKGGRAEAKKVMKDMVAKAKAKGGKFSCEGCHQDLDTYKLTSNATEEYKKLQAASGIK